MPQVAQQDYLYIKPENAVTVERDAAALVKVRRAIDAGTIWDCILKNPKNFEGEDLAESNISRVLGTVYGNEIFVIDGANSELAQIPIRYSMRQYEGLEAIQKNELSRGYASANDLLMPKLISTGDDNNLLMDENIGAYISVDSNFLEVTKIDSNISELKIGEHITDDYDFVNITWEDAQKLIGLPINQ